MRYFSEYICDLRPADLCQDFSLQSGGDVFIILEKEGQMRTYSLKCDCHTHTLYSRHAFSTIAENVRAAKEQGLELLASTDHFSDMLFPDWRDLRNYQYFSCFFMCQ